ncbi:anti-sigma regulatory factor [Mycobacterium paraense]|uniref:Anti-sigma regulatory factor n=1 Tax=Mycobacterium paraense TaxID=767916 RepID=A0A1X2AAN5_9MYCO|nr:ATP-binding protein [Mycobacterium paraense]ORW30122.1 anti-sigma regulatory factor [Mycobacterium paraense]ORW37012.1 anti-sigma regulatory factor [Mycobacterium paraense]ORW39829.1 anti-sigma regulatory factor [Mycobacterium paraense]ORW47111.1 anti-sigma regulatory factor [Mycobacterium paraense]
MGRSERGPDEVSDIDDRSRFVRRRVAADARSAARTRAEFGKWLDRHFKLGADRSNDLILAVNEALANAAEFAYVDAARRGTVDLTAAYDDVADTLAVTVNDRGRWRHKLPEPATVPPQPQVRGRGIPLMRTLADRLTIDRTPRGTHVTLVWTELLGGAARSNA